MRGFESRDRVAACRAAARAANGPVGPLGGLAASCCKQNDAGKAEVGVKLSSPWGRHLIPLQPGSAPARGGAGRQFLGGPPDGPRERPYRSLSKVRSMRAQRNRSPRRVADRFPNQSAGPRNQTIKGLLMAGPLSFQRAATLRCRMNRRRSAGFCSLSAAPRRKSTVASASLAGSRSHGRSAFVLQTRETVS